MLYKTRGEIVKIEKFKKRSNGLYTIYLDNFNTYDFYEEIILKYELLITKNIEETELDEILKENKKYESYYQALKLLKKTIKTKNEVTNYLKDKGYSKEHIDMAIKKLEEQGYINDKNYAKSYIHNSIITTYKGPKKIVSELEKKGLIDSDYIEALEEYSKDLEKEKLKKIIFKKIKTNHNKSAKVLKQKLLMDLINNGFHQDIIKEVLNNIDISENEEITKKEYQKYYNKLSKKYSGKELEYKLKQKMYSLGFNITKE